MKKQPRPLPAPGPFIRLFVEEATRVLGDKCAPTRCLNATRICLDVMRAFSVSARPVSVQAVAMNPEYLRRLREIGRYPNPDELKAWIEAGAWAVGIDTRTEATDAGQNAWGGHLVALVQKEWIVDAAAIQLHRPDHGIQIEDVFVGYAPRWFLKGKDTVWFRSADGAQLGYRARPADETWKTLSGFQPHVFNAAMVAQITRNIAERMNRRTVRA